MIWFIVGFILASVIRWSAYRRLRTAYAKLLADSLDQLEAYSKFRQEFETFVAMQKSNNILELEQFRKNKDADETDK